jgi:hypothetical protein
LPVPRDAVRVCLLIVARHRAFGFEDDRAIAA